jgi:CDP-diacylglycerol--glycerol-3-phosphate 3-phosphatidyltransferase
MAGGGAGFWPGLTLVDGRPELIVAVVVLAVVTEMTGVVAVQIGASRRYDGPMGKSDRAFVFGALGLFAGLEVLPLRWLDAIRAGETLVGS